MVTHHGRPVGDVPDAEFRLGPLADRSILLTRRARIVEPWPDQRLYRRELGPITLPSGQIHASDPTYGEFDVAPFARVVRPGRYPVVLTCMSDAPEPSPHDRVAAAAILLRDAPPIRWEHALYQGQKLSDLGPSEIYGYGVDGGTGCFVDAEVADDFTRSKRSFKKLLTAYEASGYTALMFPIKDEPSIAVFSSGWGDGFYGSYWGLDARGEPVCLVTDFGVLHYPRRAVIRFGEAQPLTPGALEHPALTRAGITVAITSITPTELALEARGDINDHEYRVLTRGDAGWTVLPCSYNLQLADKQETRQLQLPAPTDQVALELEVTVGMEFVRIVEEPIPAAPRSPVIRRRKP